MESRPLPLGKGSVGILIGYGTAKEVSLIQHEAGLRTTDQNITCERVEDKGGKNRQLVLSVLELWKSLQGYAPRNSKPSVQDKGIWMTLGRHAKNSDIQVTI